MTHGEAEKGVKRLVRELVSLRKAAGVSQYRIAKLTGLSREAIRLIENGERSPTLHSLLLIASSLETKLGPLLETVEGD